MEVSDEEDWDDQEPGGLEDQEEQQEMEAMMAARIAARAA